MRNEVIAPLKITVSGAAAEITKNTMSQVPRRPFARVVVPSGAALPCCDVPGDERVEFILDSFVTGHVFH